MSSHSKVQVECSQRCSPNIYLLAQESSVTNGERDMRLAAFVLSATVLLFFSWSYASPVKMLWEVSTHQKQSDLYVFGTTYDATRFMVWPKYQDQNRSIQFYDVKGQIIDSLKIDDRYHLSKPLIHSSEDYVVWLESNIDGSWLNVYELKNNFKKINAPVH
jgi:hypothetical protein